jgi:L-2-hydroxyglutarate oxidase LhgO
VHACLVVACAGHLSLTLLQPINFDPSSELKKGWKICHKCELTWRGGG